MNDNKLIITKYKDFNAAFLFKDGDIDELILAKESPFNVGDIYVGRVSTVKNDLKACFVEFMEGVNGYLSFEDIYEGSLLNRPYDGRLIQGDLVCVEVVKEPLKTKGATLSMRLTINGALSVITYDDPGVHVSSKLGKDYKRTADEFFKGRSYGYGFILRTNAASVSFDEVDAELIKNSDVLKNIESVMRFRSPFTCLYHAETSFAQRIHAISYDKYDEAVTDIPEFYNNLTGLKNLRIYNDSSLPLKAVYSFDKTYGLATERKADLKYGGYLIIEPTEALTVIDVNSGKFSKNLSKEAAIEKINAEAAKEVARQLRLRNLSGIIIVDFINQTGDPSFEAIKTLLAKEFKKDSLKTTLVDFTPLGLAEITREKRYGSIYEELRK